MNKKTIRMIVSTVFQDGGDGTRAIEIARAIKKYAPDTVNSEIIFITHGSPFEQKVLDCGFELYHGQPKTDGVGVLHDYKMTFNNFIGDKHLAKELIEGELRAYDELKPDVVLYGFWPIAGIAYRMKSMKIFGVCYVPIPLTTEEYINMIPDIPDQIRILSWFPFYIRKLFIKYLPKFIKRRLSPLRQPNIRWAARKVGCKKKIVNFFDMLQADLTLVNDMPDFYTKYNLPENVVVTGPIFSRSKTTEVIDKNILGIFDNKNKRVKIFCTLGTSGTAEQLEEVAKVFIEGVGQNWDAVILSPVAVCLMDRIKKIINGRKGVYVTDSFVPAEMIAQMADIVICHGGQGTIQNAMCAGTPLVGVSTQAEQFLNLWNIEAYGAGIKVSTKKWKAKNIQDSVLKILSHQSFNESALRMKEKMRLIDGEKNSAITFWKKLDENGYIPKSLS